VSGNISKLILVILYIVFLLTTETSIPSPALDRGSRIAIIWSSTVVALSLITITTAITTATNSGFDNIALAQTQGSNNSNTATNSSTAAAVTNVDTLRAKGQISSLASDVLAGRPSSNSSEIWVLGGDWEFGVAKGNLTNLAVDITMSQIDGKEAHHHTIESLKNITGAMSSNRSERIALINGNYTDFKGIADITTNGEIKWKDVPITVHLANGNIINFNIDPSKTEDHFKGLPVFGTVESIIDQNGRELLKR
jgi:hypothetical protein